MNVVGHDGEPILARQSSDPGVLGISVPAVFNSRRSSPFSLTRLSFAFWWKLPATDQSTPLLLVNALELLLDHAFQPLCFSMEIPKAAEGARPRLVWAR